MDPALRFYSVVGRVLMVLRVNGYASFETVDDARLWRLLLSTTSTFTRRRFANGVLGKLLVSLAFATPRG